MPIPRCALIGAFIVNTSVMLFARQAAQATPANRTALVKHYDRFLAKRLDACTTCHLPSNVKTPSSLSEFPHNPFGNRLRMVAAELIRAGKKADLPARLQAIASEDSDGDGVDNETELLLGHAPGDATDRPAPGELQNAARRRAEYAQYVASYRWQPFEPVRPPSVPKVKNAQWVRNPIDAFVAVEQAVRGLRSRPEAPKPVLLRRVYLDLIGLSPTPGEMRAFENDRSRNAYEKVVDHLLNDPRYGERWGRHWMDIWRYSDWAGYGNQVRDSKPHVWRWRDWIVEALNRDKSYDRMILEMLAADELVPEDPDALRATGFLVRNFKLLSREAWMEDVVTHTSRAFLGLTLECARCHDHRYDPIPQKEYYQVRAIFEPHNVRTDRVPGETDVNKDGLPRAYDADPQAATYLFRRGDERSVDKERAIVPGVPQSLGGAFKVEPVPLPRLAYLPDKRDFVIRESVAASEQAVAQARAGLRKLPVDSADLPVGELKLTLAEARHAALLDVLQVETLEDAGRKGSDDWKRAALEATVAQRRAAVLEARLNLLAARRALEEERNKTEALSKKAAEVEKALAAAEMEFKSAPSTEYKPRVTAVYPATSTGRRLAFARWIASAQNPLTARVAMNHIWLRHFGQAIVPSVADFGRNGRLPSHPRLLDWLAAEFMTRGWSMKAMHYLMVTSHTYRMSATPDPANARIDPDNIYLWRMNSRRMEAEVVRDNVLYVAGSLDLTLGGPEVDHLEGLTSKRRSLYLRIAAEKDVEFLKVFDSPSVNECYERRHSVIPQQALALANSALTTQEARALAKRISDQVGPAPQAFVEEAFQRILVRRPTAQELDLCLEFLKNQARRLTSLRPQSSSLSSDLRARENLVLVLFNHNDFVTVR